MEEKVKTEELTEEQKRYIEGLAWAALLSASIWALGNKLWWWFLGSLIPIWNIYVLLKLFLHGRRMSWKKGKWENFEKFHRRQLYIWWVIATLVALYTIITILSAFLNGS